MVKFSYGGKEYSNAVDMSKELPGLTSVMVGHYAGAEILCANAGALCYDTDTKATKDDRVGRVGRGIIKSCRDSGHNTVLEHGSATFLKKVPIFVARQDLRSRIASFDERSLRYCRADDGSLTYFTPEYLTASYIDSLGGSHKAGKVKLNLLRNEWVEQHERAIDLYSKFTDGELSELWDSLGVGGERLRETVRAVLPLGINTVYMDTRNLWSWIHHSRKRMCLRAQAEIGIVRRQEVKQLKQVYPTIFDGVDRPCATLTGCQEHRPCGKIKLYGETGMDYATAEKFGKR